MNLQGPFIHWSHRRFGASTLVPEVELGVREQREAEIARDELAPLHSITSSGRASKVGGTLMPSILAVGATHLG